jgi:outer membrane lipase/esterase
MNLTNIKCSCVGGAALALVIGCSPAASQSISQVVVFGDSTVDSGWYRNAAPNSTNPTYNTDFAIAVTQGGGTATTNPGPVNSQLLAGFFGLTANPANTPGGTDYATGDARNAQTNTGVPNSLQGAVPTVTQINNYLAANGGIANPNALYLISSGGNDISYATGNLPAGSQSAYVVTAATDLVAAIVQLQAAGARTFIVPDTPQSFGGATTEALRATYNTTLWQGLAAAHVNFVPADINAMYRAVQASPSTFGLIGGGGPACTQPAGIPSGWSTMCSPTSTISTLVSPDAEYTHLLADDIHLSTAGQQIEADYEYSLIVAPTEISLLAEVPVKTRQTMIETMFTQIGLSQQQRRVGSYNAWISGGVSALAMQSSAPGAPGDPGTPLGATVGVDYAFAPGWLAGGAVSVGNTTQTFSLGGDFVQNEFAVSAYAAYLGQPIWADIIGSAGFINDQVNRIVPIGIAQLSNTGSTNGSNLSLAAEGGYNFRSGPVTHGPLAGMLLQRVYIDGYTETDPFAAVGGFTALSYANQIRNSAVSELGYQASVQIGNWSPFAKLTWDHEFAGAGRTVTASLTTIAAPSYYMPAVVFGTDWMTLSAGTSFRLERGITGYAMFTSGLAQNNVTSYGAQVGVNVALNEWIAPKAF